MSKENTKQERHYDDKRLIDVKRLVTTLLVVAIGGAITASAKNVVDVAVLKSQYETIIKDLDEIKTLIKQKE